MSYHPSDYYEEQFWEELPKDLHEGSVREYLGKYGDSIDDRVMHLMRTSRELQTAGFYAPAVVASVTALEICIEFFCIRPLVEGAFLSELWALELADRVIRTHQKRELLAGILKLFGIDLTSILLPDRRQLWEVIQKVMEQRNDVVHIGEDLMEVDSNRAIECVEAFRSDVVGSIARRLKFTLDKTGKWSEVVHPSIGRGHLGGGSHYGTVNIWQQRKAKKL